MRQFCISQHDFTCQIHEDSPDDAGITEQNIKYEVASKLFVNVVSEYDGKKIDLSDLSEREFALMNRHTVISAVDLAYKMLNKNCDESRVEEIDDRDSISWDVRIVRNCLQHIHNWRVPPEFVPGFLILLIKYHFYN
jgi:hypothetical protein